MRLTEAHISLLPRPHSIHPAEEAMAMSLSLSFGVVALSTCHLATLPCQPYWGTTGDHGGTRGQDGRGQSTEDRCHLVAPAPALAVAHLCDIVCLCTHIHNIRRHLTRLEKGGRKSKCNAIQFQSVSLGEEEKNNSSIQSIKLCMQYSAVRVLRSAASHLQFAIGQCPLHRAKAAWR